MQALTQTTFTSLALTTNAPKPQSPKPKGRANDCRPETRVNQNLFANIVEGKAKRTGACIDENQTNGPDRLRTGNCTANSVRKIAKFGTSSGSDPKHARRISALDPRCAKRGIVIILHDEESFARFQRTLCPDLPDNQALDEIARLEFLRTGKMVCTDVQFTRRAIRAARKMTAEEKRICREKLRWSLYDKF